MDALLKGTQPVYGRNTSAPRISLLSASLYYDITPKGASVSLLHGFDYAPILSPGLGTDILMMIQQEPREVK